MKEKKFFKFLYWFIITIMTGIFALFAVKMGDLIADEPDFPKLMIAYFVLIFLVVAGLFAAISIFVYKDAPKRGMNRWLWMTIATFTPNLIGLIIYVIVRSNSSSVRCISCGKDVKNDYKLCPYCGSSLDMHCHACGKQVSPEWQLCPYCKSNLT